MNEYQEWAMDLLNKSIKYMGEKQNVKIRHFHPEKTPESLGEALDIYWAHGNIDFTPDALEIHFYDLVSGLIKETRFIVMKYAPEDEAPTFIVMEFDDDFENVFEVFSGNSMTDALDFAYDETEVE